MRYWSGSVDVSCVLCNEPVEKIEHLFSEFVYYAQIWERLMKSVLRNEYTESWIKLMKIMRDPRISKVKSFIIKHILQVVVHTIWRERIQRRHGEAPSLVILLIKMIDKSTRNKLTLIKRKRDKEYEGGMIY